MSNSTIPLDTYSQAHQLSVQCIKDWTVNTNLIDCGFHDQGCNKECNGRINILYEKKLDPFLIVSLIFMSMHDLCVTFDNTDKDGIEGLKLAVHRQVIDLVGNNIKNIRCNYLTEIYETLKIQKEDKLIFILKNFYQHKLLNVVLEAWKLAINDNIIYDTTPTLTAFPKLVPYLEKLLNDVKNKISEVTNLY